VALLRLHHHSGASVLRRDWAPVLLGGSSNRNGWNKDSSWVSSLKTGQLGWKCGFVGNYIIGNYIYLGLGKGPRPHKHCLSGLFPAHLSLHRWTVFTFKVGYGFISGGPQFVMQKWPFCRVLSIVATSARNNRLGVLEHAKLSWKHIVHVEVGGVMDGRYWVGQHVVALCRRRIPTSGFLVTCCLLYRGRMYLVRDSS
jgi:hypothetical protein